MRLMLAVHHPIRPKRSTHRPARRHRLEKSLLDPLSSATSYARRMFSPTGC
jgi:hypothetical protein